MQKALSRPLQGVRVLDISTMIAAPLTASLLADYGAEVVKLERPGTGDFVRAFGAQKNGQGLYWKTLSRNKKSVAIDLHFPEGQELFRRWITTFDVLIENFRPGTLERWGLAPDGLLKLNPRLIVLRVTAYGQNGPYSDRPGFGTLAEAMTGVASVTGYPDRPPLLPAFPLADVMAGYLGCSAILAALHRQQTLGVGEVIDLAIYEALLKLIELQVIEYDQNGTLHQRRGNQLEDTAPRGAYKCADGLWIALSASTQPIAERVLRAIGGEELVSDPRFRTNVDRVRHADELDELIARWCAQRDRETAIRELTKMQCAVGPLESVDTMLSNPQVVARQSVIRVRDEGLGSVLMCNVFPRFLYTEDPVIEPGPVLVGAHTEEVLSRDLGLSPQDIEDLAAKGVIACPTVSTSTKGVSRCE